MIPIQLFSVFVGQNRTIRHYGHDYGSRHLLYPNILKNQTASKDHRYIFPISNLKIKMTYFVKKRVNTFATTKETSWKWHFMTSWTKYPRHPSHLKFQFPRVDIELFDLELVNTLPICCSLNIKTVRNQIYKQINISI